MRLPSGVQRSAEVDVGIGGHCGRLQQPVALVCGVQRENLSVRFEFAGERIDLDGALGDRLEVAGQRQAKRFRLAAEQVEHRRDKDSADHVARATPIDVPLVVGDAQAIPAGSRSVDKLPQRLEQRQNVLRRRFGDVGHGHPVVIREIPAALNHSQRTAGFGQ